MTGVSSIQRPGRGADRAETLARLRGRIAAVEGGASPAPMPIPQTAPPAPAPEQMQTQTCAPVGGARSAEPGPAGLPELARPGTVGTLDGSPTVLLGLIAQITSGGGHVAVIGLPRLGLIAAAEMGAVLDRVVWVPDPGLDPEAVAAVLIDGMDLVVLDPARAEVPPTRARAITARVRRSGARLLVVGARWPGADTRIDAAVTGCVGLGRGHGRISGLELTVRVRGRAQAPRGLRLALGAEGDRLCWRDDPAPVGGALPQAVRGA